MSTIRNILVALDFSEHSEAALARALELARALGSKVHLVHAYEIPTAAVTAYGVVLPDGLWERVRAAVDRRLAEKLRVVEQAGLEGEAHLIEGPPAQAIAEVARTIPADLLVMGTRGLSGLKHILLGSVAERTIRIAPCPVLTVKSEV